MDHCDFYSMHAKNAQQHCFKYDCYGNGDKRGCFELNSIPLSNFVCEEKLCSQAQNEGLHEENTSLKELLTQAIESMKVERENFERGCYETNCMPMIAQNMDCGMENFVCEQDPSCQAQTEGFHETISHFQEFVVQSLEDIKDDSDNFQVSCKNIDAHFKTIMEHLKEESCIEEVIELKEESYHDNFEASCKNIEAHIRTILEHLQKESCIEYVVEKKEQMSVECEFECGQLERVEEKQKDCVVVEQEKFKNSDKEEKPRLRYDKSHLTIKVQPLVSEEKSPPQNELQFFQKRENSYPKWLLIGAWEHLLPYAKYMGFLTKKRKRKDDIFFLSYYPP